GYVLASLFPGDAQRLAGMAHEAGISRIFGGIHYRFDADAGLVIAENVRGLAVAADRQNGLVGLLQ
ncbi:MAG TPA: hypothetical protein VFT04_05230, partial [Gemmatimonadales bacterium]|nr:hypothetical protein [Gemmatimonadales bacterium]